MSSTDSGLGFVTPDDHALVRSWLPQHFKRKCERLAEKDCEMTGATLMSREQRAAQIWSVLAFAAKNRQILSYGLLAKLIGVPAAALGQLLEPIQAYCLQNELPPLTALVVSDDSGIPGEGFIGEDVPRAQMAVFREAWTERQPPTPAEYGEAMERLR